MGKIVDVLAPFAIMQVASGARAIQVFDSWVGALSADDYVRFAQPYSRALIERIKSTGVPVIHFGTGASGYFRELHAAGGDVMGWTGASISTRRGSISPTVRRSWAISIPLRFSHPCRNCGPRCTICCAAPERVPATSSIWDTGFCRKLRWKCEGGGPDGPGIPALRR